MESPEDDDLMTDEEIEAIDAMLKIGRRAPKILAALTAADALADWLTEAINADECAPWPKVREALRAYRAARGT